jgi:hypothetical protein
MEEIMADEGYYELQILDQAGWSLRSRFPMSADDPLVVMRARAEAELVAQEPNVRGVELVHEFLDAKTNEVRREPIYSWGSARTAVSATSTPSSRRQILRTARATGRTRPQRARAGARPSTAKPAEAPAVDPPDPAAAPRPRRRRRPWWRRGTALALGSLALAAGASILIWIGLSRQMVVLEHFDHQPVQAALFTVILVGFLGVLVWVQRRGIGALFSTPGRAPAAPTAGSGVGQAAAPAVIEIPAPVGPAPPKPRPVAPGDAVVEVQENRLLRFLRECMLHKDMRAALASDGTLRDPHIVFGVHLFLLGAAEVCVTDTASGVSDNAHLVKVMKAVMRAIGSPEDRAEAFVGRLETHRKKPEEHTMILLGQLAMDHYLEHNQAPESALSKALTRWAVPSGDD